MNNLPRVLLKTINRVAYAVGIDHSKKVRQEMIDRATQLLESGKTIADVIAIFEGGAK